MSRHNQFTIQTDCSRSLTLNIEPEGVFYSLGQVDEVSVKESFIIEPLTIKLTSSDKGEPVLSIWPGDGDVRVEKDGVDVFDLMHTTCRRP